MRGKNSVSFSERPEKLPPRLAGKLCKVTTMEAGDAMTDALDEQIKDGLQTLLSGFVCQDCQWVGTEPNRDETVERDGTPPPYRVSVYLSCPACDSPDVEDCTLCSECAREGIDNAAQADGLCEEHAAELDTDFHRDNNEPMRALVKEEA